MKKSVKWAIAIFLVIMIIGYLHEKDKAEQPVKKDTGFTMVQPETYASMQGFIDSAFVVEPEHTEIISFSPCKIKITTKVYEGETLKTYSDLLCKNLVFFVYNAFASNKIDTLEVVSTPILFNPEKGYLGTRDNEAIILKTTRSACAEVMKNRIGTDDFSMLLYKDAGVYLPTKEFEKLVSINDRYVVSVYNDLKKYSSIK